MSLDSATVSSDSEKATLFNQYFYSVFQPSLSTLLPPCEYSNVNQLLQTISISNLDVYDALSSLHPFKAKGFDDIHVGPRIFKYCSLALYITLHHLVCRSLSCGSLPSDLCTQVITPIFKSGDRS